VRIELVGLDCPVLPGVTVGLQRGREVVDARPADGGVVRWVVEVRRVEGPDLRGPYVHGRPGARFLYLSWQQDAGRDGPGGMFRRAKLMLDVLPSELSADAATGLRGTFRLTLPDGSPLCAAVRPPAIAWSAL
jgi:Family of unknown function (DUF5990)